MKIIALTIFSLYTIFYANGQNTRLELTQLGVFSTEDYSQAKVYFNQESLLKEVILSKAHVEKNYQVWRVQIYLGSGKNARVTATSTRNNFKTNYPDVEAEIAYPSPYFKVHVGNFKTRIEAESFRKKILSDYPNCRVESMIIHNN